MTNPRVEIDLNDSDEHGRSLVFLSDVQGKLEVGRMAIAFESEDGVCAPALVASINEERGTAYLWVDWSSLKEESPTDASFRLSAPDWNQMASISNSASASEPRVGVIAAAQSSAVDNGTPHAVKIVVLPSSV